MGQAVNVLVSLLFNFSHSALCRPTLSTALLISSLYDLCQLHKYLQMLETITQLTILVTGPNIIPFPTTD